MQAMRDTADQEGPGGWSTLVTRYRTAWRDRGWAVLPGLHAVKHALRFAADVAEAATPDRGAVAQLAGALAPDIWPLLEPLLREVPEEIFRLLTPHPPPTGVIALARRPVIPLQEVLAARSAAPIVFLDRPSHLGNIGAVVRAAAAAEAAAVLTTGIHDPWHPAALRGGAGLQFAIPTVAVDDVPVSDRPLVAVDPGGEVASLRALPPRALLAFGAERQGLDERILARAERRIRIPMRPGVSSLNLATAVAVVLYGLR